MIEVINSYIYIILSTKFLLTNLSVSVTIQLMHRCNQQTYTTTDYLDIKINDIIHFISKFSELICIIRKAI
nr:MAG TPA: hypothetical protein [Caudoviricetes sp.]